MGWNGMGLAMESNRSKDRKRDGAIAEGGPG